MYTDRLFEIIKSRLYSCGGGRKMSPRADTPLVSGKNFSFLILDDEYF